jgi:ubiquinone/menaquinone biosynthesis C-methylase UbiE
MRDGKRAASQYDSMAAYYSANQAGGVCNSLYERPATKALLGDVRGKQVLEVGCGTGVLTEWLLDKGARVTAFDVSPEMTRIARERLGGRTHLVVADLEEPLQFVADGSVDVVVASLVLHYVRDWAPVFAEFRRVLRPGGCVVFSTHHPAADWKLFSADNYFAVKQVTDTWGKGSQSHQVTFWCRPLSAMTEVISSAGFLIERLVEPLPTPEMASVDPEVDQKLQTAPDFLFFRLRAAGPGPSGGWQAQSPQACED